MALPQGDWVFVDGPRGGGNEPDWFKQERGYTDHRFPGELFDLKTDLSERTNRYAEQPGIVAELKDLLARVRGGDGRSDVSERQERELTE